MIKVYRTTATIKAEQFDGSDNMIDKYHIEIDGAYGFRLETLEGWLGVNVNDWIVAGIDGEYWPIEDEAFKRIYAELPVIPKNIACLIKQNKEWNYNLGMVFDDAYSGHIWEIGVGEWIIAHTEMFARAWLDGYRVEEDE